MDRTDLDRIRELIDKNTELEQRIDRYKAAMKNIGEALDEFFDSVAPEIRPEDMSKWKYIVSRMRQGVE